jgi:S1-C subfamily serine protease
LKEAVEYLGNRIDPLNVLLAQGDIQTAPATASAGRKVTLGTVPDFAYAGEGVRLSDVTPGTPAAAARLREGDVLVRINEREVRNLREYADVLRQLTPGAQVTIHFRRDGVAMTVTTSVIAR